MTVKRESGECVVRLIFGAIVILGLVAASADAGAEECTAVTATAHPNYPPISWSEEGTLVGAGPQLVRMLAEQANVALKLVHYGTWPEAQAAIDEGRTDIVAGLYFNSKRAETMMFLQPAFMMDPVAVFVRANPGFFYASRDSLAGREGLAVEGESYGLSLDRYMNVKLDVERTPSMGIGLDRLAQGEVAYMIGGLLPGRAEMKRLSLTDKIAVADPELIAEPVFLAVSNKSPCRRLVMSWRSAVSTAKQYGKVEAFIAAAEENWASRGGGAQ